LTKHAGFSSHTLDFLLLSIVALDDKEIALPDLKKEQFRRMCTMYEPTFTGARFYSDLYSVEFQKQIEETIAWTEQLEESTKNLDVEAKQLHNKFKQNREICEG
jgi:hypothetical protein